MPVNSNTGKIDYKTDIFKSEMLIYPRHDELFTLTSKVLPSKSSSELVGTIDISWSISVEDYPFYNYIVQLPEIEEEKGEGEEEEEEEEDHLFDMFIINRKTNEVDWKATLRAS